MLHTRRIVAALALSLAFSAGPAAGQSADTTLIIDEAAVAAALRSPGALWAFVTAPETRWVDRMAASWRAFPAEHRIRDEPRGTLTIGGIDVYGAAPAPPRFVLPMSWFPRVVAARRELARERAIHNWGMQRRVPPGSRMASIERPWHFEGERRRSVLGHVWMVPGSPSDEPATPEERARREWPVQVEWALDVLYRGFEDTSRPAEFFAAALTLPCATEDDAYSLVFETRRYATAARAVTPAVVGAWRNAALNAAWPHIRNHVNSAFYTIGISRAEEAFWLGQALMEDVAASAADEDVPNLALHLDWLDSDERPGWEIRRPGAPDAAIWALARRADRLPASVAPYRRRDAAADVLQMADTTTFAGFPRPMQTDSVAQEEAFTAYRAWFAERRGELARRAAAQAPRVEAARRTMRTRVCAASS